MWTLGLLLLVVGAWSAPVDVSPECAACQLFAVALKKNLLQGENANKTPAAAAHCNELPQCRELTHCEIVKSLLAAPTRNISTAMMPQFHKVNTFLTEVAHQCEREPHLAVLDSQPGPALCTLCFLVYYFFQFMNNAILNMPFLQLVPDIIKFTCLIVMDLHKDIPPPVCEALLADGALPALLKAIADSMGSFYDLVGIQGLGCPSYQTLFDVC